MNEKTIYEWLLKDLDQARELLILIKQGEPLDVLYPTITKVLDNIDADYDEYLPLDKKRLLSDEQSVEELFKESGAAFEDIFQNLEFQDNVYVEVYNDKYEHLEARMNLILWLRPELKYALINSADFSKNKQENVELRRKVINRYCGKNNGEVFVSVDILMGEGETPSLVPQFFIRDYEKDFLIEGQATIPDKFINAVMAKANEYCQSESRRFFETKLTPKSSDIKTVMEYKLYKEMQKSRDPERQKTANAYFEHFPAEFLQKCHSLEDLKEDDADSFIKACTAYVLTNLDTDDKGFENFIMDDLRSIAEETFADVKKHELYSEFMIAVLDKASVKDGLCAGIATSIKKTLEEMETVYNAERERCGSAFER